jgi:hypothetical protein
MPSNWSQAEVQATIADYFDMLASELRGEPYNKAQHNRRLASRLDHRSRVAVEKKHQNISAVLIELGCPYIDGYKPLFNYQSLLLESVAERLDGAKPLRKAMAKAVSAPVSPPTQGEATLVLDTPPDVHESGFVAAEDLKRSTRAPRRGINYLEREAQNASLGRAGEELVLAYERTRLIEAGRKELARRIEHLPGTEGDGAGFDIRSFEKNGADRLIEVKTTAYGKQTPFFVSRNEVATSRELAAHYHLYRVFRMRTAPRLYTMRGSLSEAFRLQSELFSARVA